MAPHVLRGPLIVLIFELSETSKAISLSDNPLLVMDEF
jgi:hypothetical protein